MKNKQRIDSFKKISLHGYFLDSTWVKLKVEDAVQKIEEIYRENIVALKIRMILHKLFQPTMRKRRAQ